jgi:hypothetical protein
MEKKLIQEERDQASFKPRQMTYYMFGGEDIVVAKEKIFQMVESDPLFNNQDNYFLDRKSLYMYVPNIQKILCEIVLIV